MSDLDGKIYSIGDFTNQRHIGDILEEDYIKFVDEGKISTDGEGWSYNYISDDKYTKEVENKLK
jgi:hypothetical protein